MKRQSGSQRQMMLMLGLVFLVLGISMLGSNRGGGIAFLATAIVFFLFSAGAFGTKR